MNKSNKGFSLLELLIVEAPRPPENHRRERPAGAVGVAAAAAAAALAEVRIVRARRVIRVARRVDAGDTLAAAHELDERGTARVGRRFVSRRGD